MYVKYAITYGCMYECKYVTYTYVCNACFYVYMHVFMIYDIMLYNMYNDIPIIYYTGAYTHTHINIYIYKYIANLCLYDDHMSDRQTTDLTNSDGH